MFLPEILLIVCPYQCESLINIDVFLNMSSMEIITRNEIRILRPDEYHALREGSKKLSNQIWLDAMLLTGMRYEELRRLQQYPSWFKGGYIDMPKGNGNKTKKYARQRERTIHLSTMGKIILPIFLQGKVLPSRQSMDINLKRWAWNAPMNDTDISVKTFRKTWESWMVSSYPGMKAEIFLSQGHTEMISLNHYLNIPFDDVDRLRMKPYVEGWY